MILDSANANSNKVTMLGNDKHRKSAYKSTCVFISHVFAEMLQFIRTVRESGNSLCASRLA